jgi:ubiquinone/menaquinone biosynthesis C-methylase UbiE
VKELGITATEGSRILSNSNHYKTTKAFHDAAAIERGGFYDSGLHQTKRHMIWMHIMWHMAKKCLDHPESVLDAGCGRGDFALDLTEVAPRVVGCDISEEMLSIAKSLAPMVEFKQADLLSLPFSAGEFDSVVCVNTFQHILPQDRHKVLAEFARVAKNQIVIEYKNRNSLYYRRKEELSFAGITTHLAEIDDLTSGLDGFSLTRVRGIFGPLVFSPWVIASFSRDSK